MTTPTTPMKRARLFRHDDTNTNSSDELHVSARRCGDSSPLPVGPEELCFPDLPIRNLTDAESDELRQILEKVIRETPGISDDHVHEICDYSLVMMSEKKNLPYIVTRLNEFCKEGVVE